MELQKISNSPQEKIINHTMVGQKHKNYVTPSLLNPHNYRLYFSFTKESFNPKEGMVSVWLGQLKNYDSEFTALGEGVRITIKKHQVEVINKLTEQEWFTINRMKAKEEITSLLTKIDGKCIEALKKFIKVYGGSSDFKILKREGRPNLILNTKSDSKVMQEPFIDSMPVDMAFETSIVKKVYKEQNVEFKEPIYAARHLENSALNEFAPMIAEAIKQIALSHPGERLRYLKSQVNKFEDIKLCHDDIIALDSEEKHKFSTWLFERFGN